MAAAPPEIARPAGALRSAFGSVLSVLILLLIGVLAFSIRLFSVIKYESVIHEFDPYFNYRVTQFLVKNGIYDFWNWFDDRTWYPLGRVIGGTVYPGLTLTAGSMWWVLNSLNIPLSVETVCVFTAPVFSAFAAWATYLLTKEVKGTGAGLTAAALLAMDYIMAPKSRTVEEMDVGWNHGKCVEGNRRKVQCNYCGKKMDGGVTRLKQHLAGIKGNVASCPEVPLETRREMLLLVEGKQKDKLIADRRKQLVEEELTRTARQGDSSEEEDDANEYADLRRDLRESMREHAATQWSSRWSVGERGGYFLNPKYQYANDVVNDDEVLNGFHRVVNRMVNDNETRININREAERFRLKTGAFGSNQFQSAVTRCLPAEWWSIYAREDAPNLTRLAVRIFNQTVSSSNCERNWTTFSLIHTRPRNRLTMTRLEKLVFVHYNMRLRIQNVQRSGDNQNVIDLDEIFHDQDPLTAWTREKEAPLLDGREDEWLDDNLDIDPQDTAANARRPEKRKKIPNVLSRQVDNDKDDSTDSGGNGATLPTGVYQSHEYENPGDQSHEYSGDWSSDQPREHRMDDVYAGGSSYHDVSTPSDNYNNTYDSSFTSYYPYNTSEAEAAEQYSTFDGLNMTSFFNNTDINLYYPYNQQPYRDDYDNYEPF